MCPIRESGQSRVFVDTYIYDFRNEERRAHVKSNILSINVIWILKIISGISLFLSFSFSVATYFER